MEVPTSLFLSLKYGDFTVDGGHGVGGEVGWERAAS
ncbi:MAG: hypothetical protein UZ07_CHB004000196, partial [Chlorobi bacterium OLB7]